MKELDGLEELHSYLLDLERQTGMKPPVVLESTVHYHAPVRGDKPLLICINVLLIHPTT